MFVMKVEENYVSNEKESKITEVIFCKKDVKKEPQTETKFDGIAETKNNKYLKPDELFSTSNVSDCTNDFLCKTSNLNEGNEEDILHAVNERKRVSDESEFINKKSKLNDNLFDRSGGLLIDNNDLKAVVRNSELFATAEFTKTNENKSEVISMFNNEIPSESQKENSSLLKTETIHEAEMKEVQFKPFTFEKNKDKGELIPKFNNGKLSELQNDDSSNLKTDRVIREAEIKVIESKRFTSGKNGGESKITSKFNGKSSGSQNDNSNSFKTEAVIHKVQSKEFEYKSNISEMSGDKCETEPKFNNGKATEPQNDVSDNLKMEAVIHKAEDTEIETKLYIYQKRENKDEISKFNNGKLTEAQNYNSNNLKTEAVIREVENKDDKSNLYISEKKTVKSTLKIKQMKSIESCPKSKRRNIMTIDKNSKHLKRQNSFDSKQDDPKSVKKVSGNNTVSKSHEWQSNLCEINIPLVGKNVMVDTNDKPFTSRYDLAIEVNKRRFRHQLKEGFQISSMTYEEWREQQNNRSEQEKEIEAAEKENYHLSVAQYIMRITVRILQLLQSDCIDEKRIARLFTKFLSYSVTPTSLLYVPQFVHTMMLCRGNKDFSQELRSITNECYYKCHCMFPVPVGCNFETVYTSEIRKNLPDGFDRLDNFSFDYDDFSDSDNFDSESIDEIE